ncbi:DUF3828 domain-containing protein [Leclercia adecarboxylata]|uniref:DUF3828 domain-containing protein n=1 Tax=Leclercia adecarboxylata TaxID=83655 RepID=UPI0013FE2DEE|nr:DUF3828 domain-containing protein [Leclercia adecarboxylata]QIM43074.1 DUF3828 domain-containing protein [Leclercia adecarboxylata]
MKLNNLLKTLLIVLAFLFTSFSVNSAEIECASPQERVTQFYKWYLNEIKSERYPLTIHFKDDKDKLKNWLSEDFLKKIQEPESRNEIDYDYFTFSQDFFEPWLKYISAKNVKQNGRRSEVHLLLGVNDTLRQYTVHLVRANCWKITSVQRAH